MAAGINGQRTDIRGDYALVNVCPSVTVVGRTENAASTADKVSSCKDVTVGADSQRAYVVRQQTVVNRVPALAAITGSKHAKPVGPCKDDVIRIDSYGANIRCDQTIVFLAPRVSIIT